MREPVIEVAGIAAALQLGNVNTDAIIPSAWLRSPTLDLAKGLFAGWRYTEAGAEQAGFVLNREPYRRASILVAGANFGCGSSREAAVWALMRFGIRCVLAPSFADIFRENAFRNGLVAGVIEPEAVPRIVAAIMHASGPAPFRARKASPPPTTMTRASTTSAITRTEGRRVIARVTASTAIFVSSPGSRPALTNRSVNTL